MIKERKNIEYNIPQNMGHFTDWVNPILEQPHSSFPEIQKVERNEAVEIEVLSIVQSVHKTTFLKVPKPGRRVFSSSGRQDQKSPARGLRITKVNLSHPFFTSERVLVATSRDLERVIREAEQIRGLEYDWDQEGGQPVSSALLDASVAFVREYYSFLSFAGVNIPVPDIDPVRNGSVDIVWQTTKAQLLVNIRNLDGKPHAFFYGDLYENKSQLKGSFSLSGFYEPLAYWMKKLV